MANMIAGHNYYTRSANEIQSIAGHLSAALIGDTLSIDTVEIVVRPGTEVPSDAFDAGQYIQCYSNNLLIGKFFVDSKQRLGDNIWRVNASSAIGLLSRRIHNGGVYVRETVGTVLDGIIGSAFTYTVDSDVSSQLVAGWLPRASARDNLHQLMLALGINITKDLNGDIVFGFVSAGTPTAISNDRVYLGGNVSDGTPASRVEVVSHQYAALSTDETVVLFDNTTGASVRADHQLVAFSDAPVHDLVASAGLTIHESNANYAVVSGMGVLTGQIYTHTMTLYAKDNPSATVANVRSVSADTLINDLNGPNVLDRLYNYYTSATSVHTDIVANGELPNKLVTLEDAFGDTRSLWIKSMDITVSTVIRASCEMLDGYTPAYNGNLYTHRVIVTWSMTLTLPDVSRIRLILIGGGDGGQGGMDGADGFGGDAAYGGDLTRSSETADDLGYVYDGGSQDTPLGGEAGEPGAAGKVFATDIDVTGGSQVAITVGAGGTGGASNGGAGTAGGVTTAVLDDVTYSSADGQNSYPFVDLFSGNTYCVSGLAGHAGGNGGQTDTESLYAANGKDGLAGANIGTQTGGAGGAGYDETVETSGGTRRRRASGGGGGGAAYGDDGSDGTAGSWDATTGLTSGGDGGDGGDATAPDTPTYGCGGAGGNGGGAGGNGAGCRIDNFVSTWNVAPGAGGTGGTGSRGGHGGAGCVLIYY